jgi:GNAT superfamily N-acetyltransferase
MNQTDTLTIRRLRQDDSITELTELLHRAYKALADMGFRFVASYQDEEETRKRAAKGECWLVLDGERIIGTITYYSPSSCDGNEWYDRDDVAVFGQFAVEPELQKQGIGGMLIGKAEERAREDGAAEIALDTSEGAHHLIAYYGNKGYRHVGYTQWRATNYRSVLMSKRIS